MDILITSLKDYISTNSSYTGANYDAEDIAFAFHSNYIAGWGHDENQEQVLSSSIFHDRIYNFAQICSIALSLARKHG